MCSAICKTSKFDGNHKICREGGKKNYSLVDVLVGFLGINGNGKD
ncbi:hypothetical protein [Kluyvera georgiana]